jgi:tripartite-type tricarboxylate transporter receptor subunit TctC
MIKKLTLVLAMAILCLFGNMAMANITIIVPFSAGGNVDLWSRQLASFSDQHHNTRTIIQNRAGAGGLIGYNSYLTLPSDQNSLIGVGPGIMLFEPMRTKEIDPLRDLTVISPFLASPEVMAINTKTSKVKTMKELFGQTNNKLSITIGVGGTAHEFFARWMQKYTAHELIVVPFKGSGDVKAALLGGHIDIMLDNLGIIVSNVGKDIEIMALGSAPNDSRFNQYPLMHDWMDGFIFYNWSALAVNSKLDKAQIQELRKKYSQHVFSKDFQKQAHEQGMAVMSVLDGAFETQVKKQAHQWRIINDQLKILKAN